MATSKPTIPKAIKEYYDAKIKRYAVVVAIVLCLLGGGIVFLVVFGKDVYSEYKEDKKVLQHYQDQLKAEDEAKRQRSLENRIRDSLLKQIYESNQQVRDKNISESQKQRDDRIKKILSPEFSGNADSLRSIFSNY